MDNKTRLAYLETMGVDVWQPKAMVSKSEVLIETPVSLAAQEIKTIVSETNPNPIIQKSANPQSITQDYENIAPTISPSIQPVPPVQIETVTPSVVHIVKTDNWADLETTVSHCQQCRLCESRTQTVFGSGNRQADWMLIGEAPGESEDLQGQPFVGVAGLLMTEMIRAVGLKRDDVFISNILKCRPPNNRDPRVEEIKACHHYLESQIALVQPKIILAVGRIAAQNLLNTTESLAKLRGTVHYLGNIPLIVVYHPAYLLRFLNQKRKAWQDLQLALTTYYNNNNENIRLH